MDIHRFGSRPQVPLKHGPSRPPDDGRPVRLWKRADQVDLVVPAVFGRSVHGKCLLERVPMSRAQRIVLMETGDICVLHVGHGKSIKAR